MAVALTLYDRSDKQVEYDRKMREIGTARTGDS